MGVEFETQQNTSVVAIKALPGEPVAWDGWEIDSSSSQITYKADYVHIMSTQLSCIFAARKYDFPT